MGVTHSLLRVHAAYQGASRIGTVRVVSGALVPVNLARTLAGYGHRSPCTPTTPNAAGWHGGSRVHGPLGSGGLGGASPRKGGPMDRATVVALRPALIAGVLGFAIMIGLVISIAVGPLRTFDDARQWVAGPPAGGAMSPAPPVVVVVPEPGEAPVAGERTERPPVMTPGQVSERAAPASSAPPIVAPPPAPPAVVPPAAPVIEPPPPVTVTIPPPVVVAPPPVTLPAPPPVTVSPPPVTVTPSVPPTTPPAFSSVPPSTEAVTVGASAATGEPP